MGRTKPIKRPMIQSTGIGTGTDSETETETESEAGSAGGNGISVEEKSLSVLAHEGKPKLEQVDFFRIEMLYAKMELEQVKSENCELKAQLKELQHTLSVRSIRNDGQVHSREMAKWKNVAANFMLSLGPKYQVDFTKASYDDETGTIHVLEPDGRVQRETDGKE